jgi:DNA-binding GntR family transcriptional regulator
VVAQAPADAMLSPIARPRSLTSIVVDQIRELIITGRLALGDQLSENALAEQLGVSRTPVREAFLRLATERLVIVRPQRGTFVFEYDATELREICELREVLETGALRVALSSGRKQLTTALAARIESAEPIDEQTASAYQGFDTAFHETLVRATENRELIDAYTRISSRVRAIRFRLTTSLDQIKVSHAAHAEIVAAMIDGADARAEARLRHHVYSSYRFFLGTLGQDRQERRV